MRRTKSSKQITALLRSVRWSFRKVAAEARREIKRGIPPEVAGVGTSWSLSNTTYLHISATKDELWLRAVVQNYTVAEVRRRARRPGIRESDLRALKAFETEGPGLVVSAFVNSTKEVLGCGDPYVEMKEVLSHITVQPWSRKGGKRR